MLTINSHFIRAILRNADQYNVDIHTVLSESGISPEIYQEQQGVVHVDQFVRLVQRAWYWFDDEYWGLGGTRCQPGLFALMARYVQQFDTLGALLNELCRFYNTTRDDGEFSVDFQGDDVIFSVKLLNPERDVDHFLSEFKMVSFHRFFGWICNKRIILDRVTFAYEKPEHSYAYRVLFPCEQVFDQPRNSFVFKKRYLASPLIRSNSELKTFLKTAPAD
ncbi:MAG: AraC family transcriptional regulator, partial [Pseudomonadales bacterium]|nr:AraC family transcriptional regulator [Pseudomonadales bacterium]